MTFWVPLSLICSFLIVAFGQPAWTAQAGWVASAAGYALFWKAMLQWRGRLARFLLAAVWLIAVQAIQLSWMTSTHYMGPLILVVYAIVLLGLGAQFGLLSILVPNTKDGLSQFSCFALAGGGVLLEGARLYFLTGFTWNPAGLALTGSGYAIQMASIIGIYGLSFWVFWTNLVALTFFVNHSIKRAMVWVLLVIFPHAFGAFHEMWVKSRSVPEEYFTAAAVDTGIKVEEKNRDRQQPFAFIPPLVQWERVWSYLQRDEPIQLIVLPEAAFPYGANQPFCPLKICEARWKFYFGEDSIAAFPPLQPPYAFLFDLRGESHWMVTNAFFAQALANHFQADLIVGLDYDDEETERTTNAAFFFRSNGQLPERYDKRILVPVGEYVPFQKVEWVANFLSHEFGIEDSFDSGEEAKVFQSFIPIGTPICLEETYSGLVRDLRNKGAKILVSLSNDVWFPASQLAQQHLDHARVRAVENGVYLIRSSNMGWTGGIDCFGEPIRLQSPGTKGAVYLSLPIFSYHTLFSLWGDIPVFCVSGLSFLSYLLVRMWTINSRLSKLCS